MAKGAKMGNRNAAGTHAGTGRSFKPTLGSTLKAGAAYGTMFGALGALGGPVGAAAGFAGGALAGGAYHRTGNAGRKYAHKKSK